MKRLKFVLATMFAILATTVFVYAQTDSTGTGGTGGSLDPLAVIFASMLSLSVVVLPITGWVSTHLTKGSVSTQVLSWIVALGLAALGHFMNLGIFGTYSWFWTIGYGAVAALTANGLADTSMVQAILKAIAAKAGVKQQ